MNLTLDIWSILIILGVSNGFVFSLLLLTRKIGTKQSNRILALIILILVWLQLEFLSIRNAYPIEISLFYGTRLGSWLILGPLTYFYVMAITRDNFKIRQKQIVHFLPFILITILIPMIINEPFPDRAVHYGMLSVVKYYGLGTTPFQWLYGVVFILQFFHMLVYILISGRELKHYSERIKANYSNIDSINLVWLRNLNLGLIVILISSVAFLFILFFTNFYTKDMDYLYIIPVTILVYVIGYKAIQQPEIFRDELKQFIKSSKYEKTGLTPEKSTLYLEQLMEYMEKNKPYLDNELKLLTLAKELEIAPHHLSQVINEHLNLNFFDFVNQYRVEEAKKELTKGLDNRTLIAIAFDVGFNNKASFNNYFKKYTGMTPTHYLKEEISDK